MISNISNNFTSYNSLFSKENKTSEEIKNNSSSNLKSLTPEDEKQVEELKKRDREVRQHEQAHLAAGAGIVVSGPTYQFQRGPDGKEYAIGGEVQIDASPIPDDPEATIRKMQQVQAAALAPAEPSPQDRKVASQAAKNQAQARAELIQNKYDKPNKENNLFDVYNSQNIQSNFINFLA